MSSTRPSTPERSNFRACRRRCLQSIPHRRSCMKNRSFTALFYRLGSSLVFHRDISNSPDRHLHAGQSAKPPVLTSLFWLNLLSFVASLTMRHGSRLHAAMRRGDVSNFRPSKQLCPKSDRTTSSRSNRPRSVPHYGK